MNKTTKILIAVIAVVAVVAIVLVMMNSKSGSKLNVNSVEDLKALADEIYAGVTIQMPPMIVSEALDMSDLELIQHHSGLKNTDGVEHVLLSESMVNAQAYSLVLVKVKDGADANSIAKTMNENINERKWVCVTAEKIYTTASGNVVCLVMSNADTAKTVYESFKTLAGKVGQEYERTAEEPEMPEDMLPGQDGLIDIPAAM